MRTLQNRVAVVTGAGSGIGRGLALEFAKRGCRVAIQDVAPDRIAQTADEVRTLGAEVLVDSFDVSSADAFKAFADRVQDELGGAQVLVNNAGVALSGDFVDLTLEEWEWIVGINLWGVVYGSKFFLPQMLAQEEGHLVNLSSLFGIIGVPSQTAYCATKFAVRGMTESLDIELADTNVGVTSVHPGAIATNIVIDSRHHLSDHEDRKARKLIAKGMKPERAAQHIIDAIESQNPRLRVGKDAIWADRVARMLPVSYRRFVRRFSEG